jgi:hypothetical protein
MIHVGNRVPLRICCLECGQPTDPNYDTSDFWFIRCSNKDCPYAYSMVVVERRTGIVISCDARVYHTPDGPKRFSYPMYDDDGNLIWPKKSVDVKS